MFGHGHDKNITDTLIILNPLENTIPKFVDKEFLLLYIKVMFMLKKSVICPILAAAALLAGSAAYAAGTEPASEPEIAATLPAAASVTQIDLSAPESAPEGVVFSGDTVTITAPGIYRVSGSMDGQLIVNADGPTELVLAGVHLQGEACLQNTTKDALTLTLEEGSLNVLLDGLTAPDDNAQPLISSKGALTIGGSGTLTAVSGGSDALKCKDGFILAGGTVFLRAADEGADISGAMTVADGNLLITAGGDGVAVEKDRVAAGDISISGGSVTITGESRGMDAKEGNIFIGGGEVTIDSVDDGLRALDITHTGGTIAITTRGYTPADTTTEEEIAGDGIDGDTVSLAGDITIVSAGDGVQALTYLNVSGGNLAITSGGGGGDAINHSGGDMFGPPGRGGWSQSAADDGPSAKGLKSDGDITITGGTIGLSTADDSLHCARLCTIEGGEIYIYSSDDAIHADDMILINGGDITVYDCFEGLEGFAVEVHGGNILLYAVNDCVNANGPEGWGGSKNAVTDSVSGYDTTYYWQSGGWADYIVYSYGSNMGDGMDSNGSMFITGGHLTVSTPGTFMENGIDSGFGYFIISGGEVMAGGASAMQPTPSSNTEQCVAVISATIEGGTPIYIYDSEGNEIWNHTIANYTTCLIVSHPGMTQGNIYTVTYGEKSTTLDFTETNSISLRSSSRGGRPF